MFTRQSTARTPLAVLEQYWGYNSFRSCQEDVVTAVLARQDALVVMATGAGKSLCYQIPPLVTGRPCVVISPLISLMEDQVAALCARDIKACFLGSAQLSKQVKDGAWAGQYTFIYMTPELAISSLDKLKDLHCSTQGGLSLVAVDEAHCVSEWGHDFRHEFRHLGQLRDALPGVPLLGLTATAHQRVQDDIVASLRLRPGLCKRVMTFERTNLHFSASQKGSFSACFADLISRKRSGEDFGATLIYTLTTREVDEVAEFLAASGFQGRVGRYHAKLTAEQRRTAHSAFLRDDLDVMVATVAYGMGIDKPNVRCIVHYGAPGAVEAYYQQAGRAGRNGLPSRCHLVWGHQDLQLLDRIKSAGQLSSQGRSNYETGVTTMQAYCATAGCRHAFLVNFFAPGTMPENGPCSGGCDNCDKRVRGEMSERDLAQEARLLIGAVMGVQQYFGLGKAVAILRGSTAKDMKPWMAQLMAHDGRPLHGAGKSHSEAWWKALAGLLAERHLLQYKTVRTAGHSFSAMAATPEGEAFLRARTPLLLQLSANMQAEERTSPMANAASYSAFVAARTAAASGPGATPGAVAGASPEEEAERLELLRQLKVQRKAIADVLHQAPDTLVSEATLLAISRHRPASLPSLGQVAGMSASALQFFGKALLDVVTAAVAGSRHLKHDADWQSTRQPIATAPSPPPPSSGAYLPCPALLKRAVPPNLLAATKAAALEAAERFANGQSAADIASKRLKPIQVSTVIGYLADAAGEGYAVDFERLVAEARLTEAMARCISSAVAMHGATGLGAVKTAVEGADYGQVKLVVAMLAQEAMWFAPGAPQPAATPTPAGGAPADVPDAGAATSAPAPGETACTPATATPLQSRPAQDDEDLAMLDALENTEPKDAPGMTQGPLKRNLPVGMRQPPKRRALSIL